MCIGTNCMYVTVCACVTCLIIIWHQSIPLPASLSAAPSPRAAPPTSRCPHCITPPIQSPTTPSSSSSSSLPSVFISLLHPSSFVLPYMVAFILNSSSGLLCTAPPTPPPAPSCHPPMQFPTTPLPHQPASAFPNYVLYVWLQYRSCLRPV